MRKIYALLIGLAISTVVYAATFTTFTPATGILKGNASSPVTTAATSSDVRALWSGTCNASSFLRGDGACASAATSPGGADTNVQYNSSGSFGGESAFSYNASTNTLAVDTITSTTVQVGGVSVRDASILTSGTISTARLGSGTANSTTFLRGDNTWQTISGGTPAGANTQVQYNDSGSFGAEAAFTYNPSTNTLSADTINQNGNQVLDTGQPAQTIFFTANSNGNGLAIVNGSTGTAATNALDVANSSNTLRAALTGTGYTGTLLTGGLTGQVGALYTIGSVSLELGTNSTKQVRLTSGGGMTVGAPTGGDQGAGTVNATGVYVNGVAVATTSTTGRSCGVNIAVSGPAISDQRGACSGASMSVTNPSTGVYVLTHGLGTAAYVAQCSASFVIGSTGAAPQFCVISDRGATTMRINIYNTSGTLATPTSTTFDVIAVY